MLRRTITKKLPLVILAAFVGIASSSCSAYEGLHGRPPKFDNSQIRYGAPETAGILESDEISESSGLAASKCQDNVFWTHNDSGDGPFIFAIDPTGKHLGVWRLANAENVDWEDIAAFKDASGKCFIYVGDIGNSAKEMRGRLKIYRIPEPIVPDEVSDSTRRTARETAAPEVLEFNYPDKPHDAETLLVHPSSGQIYIVTRERKEPAGVFTLKGEFSGEPETARRIGEIKVPAVPFGFLTGGDISPDGTRLMLCDHFAAYEMALPANASNFENIFLADPIPVDVGKRKQGEGIAFSPDGRSIYATSEGINQPLNRIRKIEQ